MTTDNDPKDEKFGNDEWGDEAGPPGPGNESEAGGETAGASQEFEYREPKKRPSRPSKKKTSRKAERVENPNRPSAEEAMRALKVQMGENTPKVPKGKFSGGRGGLNNPFAICLVSAIIALVLAVAANMYFSPSRNQFTTLTNEHNALNSSVVSLVTQVGDKASVGALGTERERIDTLEGKQVIDRQNITDLGTWKGLLDFTQYLKVAENYSFGGNQSGNVSGTLNYVLNDSWTKWFNLSGNLSTVKTTVLGLEDSYDPNSVFSFGGNTSGNYSGNLSGALNKTYSNWNGSTGLISGLASSFSSATGAINSTLIGVISNLATLSTKVGTLNTSVSNLSTKTFTIGNCSGCNLESALMYLYNGSRSDNWSYPNSYP